VCGGTRPHRRIAGGEISGEGGEGARETGSPSLGTVAKVNSACALLAVEKR